MLDAFFDPATGERRPVLLYVGRFLGFKRVPLLIRAYARARERMSCPRRSSSGAACRASGRASTPTPSRCARTSTASSSAGWRGHDELPLGLGCADCFVAPSTDEPFGLVYLEAMASGCP